MSDPALSPVFRTAPAVVDYPASDGRPVAETDFHFGVITYVAHGLRIFFANRPDAYVGANLLVHYEPGNRRRHLSPDVFVAFGVPKTPRQSYLLWEEKTPAFVLEVTSKSTRQEDLGTKRQRYAEWGVREYFLFDPRHEHLASPLLAFRLRGGRYQPVPPERMPNGALGWYSETLELFFQPKGAELRLYDPASGRYLLTHEETERARRQADRERQDAEARAAEERAARKALEAQKAELQALVRELRERLSR